MLHVIYVIGLRYIEWFSYDCRRTKAKVISLGSIFASFSSTVYVPPRVSQTAAGNRAYVFTAVKTTGHTRDLSTYRFITQNFHGQPPPLEPSRY